MRRRAVAADMGVCGLIRSRDVSVAGCTLQSSPPAGGGWRQRGERRPERADGLIGANRLRRHSHVEVYQSQSAHACSYWM